MEQRAPALPAAPRAALLLAFAALLFLRMPAVLLHPRFWAEEGKIFYEHAVAMPWWRAILLPYGGYLNLVANTAPVLARALVPLEWAPRIVTLIGLVFQCCPAVLLLWSRDRWLSPWPVRIAALLLLGTAPQVEEVWLQTLHSQFHLALCAAIILALDIPGRRLALFGGATLFLGPLCGPAACVLLPLFLLRAAIDRSWARAAQAATLGAGAALQVLLFYSHQSGRSYGIGPIVLLCVVYIKQIVIPFLGTEAGIAALSDLQARIDARLFPWQAVLVSLGAFVAFSTALLRGRQAASLWLFAAACFSGWIAYFGAIGGGLSLLQIGGGGRYTFLPEVLAALALLALAAEATTPERWLARATAAWLIVVGTLNLHSPHAYITKGPDWLKEVAIWRTDHTHKLAIWPTGWTMTLSSE